MPNRIIVFILVLLALPACDGQAVNQLVEPQNKRESTVDVRDKTQKLKLAPLRASNHNPSATEAYQQKLHDVFIEGKGRVIRLLKDDNHGDRHQRFILRVSRGLTLLVAHNIDLAPRINALERGDTVQFRGEYVYNEKGGILHWTHHDPRQEIDGGWLIHQNKTYQ